MSLKFCHYFVILSAIALDQPAQSVIFKRRSVKPRAGRGISTPRAGRGERERGEGRGDRGEGRREEGEGRKEKGERRRGKGEGEGGPRRDPDSQTKTKNPVKCVYVSVGGLLVCPTPRRQLIRNVKNGRWREHKCRQKRSPPFLLQVTPFYLVPE